MEQRKTVRYEIQVEERDGCWATLEELPRSEEEISRLRDRARVAHPGKTIRAVKVTSTVTMEEISGEPHPAILPLEMEAREWHSKDSVSELLQDCD